MLSPYPNLDLANEITTAYYRQFSPDFPMSSNPIHIDSACVIHNDIQVVWSYFDWDLTGETLSYGMRFSVVIDSAFWLAQQEKLQESLVLAS